MISTARNTLYVWCYRVGRMHYGIVAAAAIVYTSLTSNITYWAQLEAPSDDPIYCG